MTSYREESIVTTYELLEDDDAPVDVRELREPELVVVEASKMREKRTRTVQREAYVTYIESNPEVLDNNSRNYAQKWKELTDILNNHEPRKTTKAWQKNMKEWEYALKSKFNKNKKNSRGDAPGLTNFETRALNAFGVIRQSGNRNLPLLFNPGTSQAPVAEASTSKCSSADNAFEELASTKDSDENEEPKRKRSRQTSRDPELSVVVDVLKEQNEIQKKNAEIAEKNAESFSILAKALMEMVKTDRRNNNNEGISK